MKVLTELSVLSSIDIAYYTTISLCPIIFLLSIHLFLIKMLNSDFCKLLNQKAIINNIFFIYE